MRSWLIGLITGLAFVVRGFFAGRREAKLTKERNSALADAEQQRITAEAKTNEAAQLRAQQKQEGKINAKDSADTAAHLDNKHRW